MGPGLGAAADAHGVTGPPSGPRPQLGPVMLIKAVRVLVGWSGAGPRPHLFQVPFIGHFLYRGETIKGLRPFTPAQPLCCGSEFS